MSSADIAGDGMMNKDHRDFGSVLSMSILLSSPVEFGDGELMTWDSAGNAVLHHLRYALRRVRLYPLHALRSCYVLVFDCWGCREASRCSYIVL